MVQVLAAVPLVNPKVARSSSRWFLDVNRSLASLLAPLFNPLSLQTSREYSLFKVFFRIDVIRMNPTRHLPDGRFNLVA